MDKRIRRKRYHIPEVIVAQVEANTGFLEVSNQLLIDIADNSLVAKV